MKRLCRMPEWAMQLLAMAGSLGTAYAAIRADLAELRVRAENAAAEAVRAHQRIDQITNLRK